MIAEALELSDRHGVKLTGQSYANYDPQPVGTYVQDVCHQHLVVKSARDMKPGDVLTLKVETAPCHVAIVGQRPDGVLTLIHAYSGGLAKVVEHPIDYRWRRRISCCFSFSDVED